VLCRFLFYFIFLLLFLSFFSLDKKEFLILKKLLFFFSFQSWVAAIREDCQEKEKKKRKRKEKKKKEKKTRLMKFPKKQTTQPQLSEANG